MTPAALRATRRALGLSSGRLAELAGLRDGYQVAGLERAKVPSLGTWGRAREARLVLLSVRRNRLDLQFRAARRERAAWAWAEDGRGGSPARRAMLRAAAMLDVTGEAVLADWLLRARPNWDLHVATRTGVHILRRNLPDPWDELNDAGLIDHDVHEDLYEGPGCYVWAPRSSMLLP